MGSLQRVIAFAIMTGMASAAIAAEPEDTHLERLGANEISRALIGKLISYSPPGWSDAGVHEEFWEGGIWRGIYYGRGPFPFAGRWTLSGNQLCVTRESGYLVGKRAERRLCRTLWRNPQTGGLLIEHLAFKEAGLMVVAVSALPRH